MSNTSNSKTFHLGITMAGAVSAGAYTAGFMDYLLEALSNWEAAKEKNRLLEQQGKKPDLRIPMHDVSIDVLGGASAGGMVSMITALAFFKGDLKPVKKPSSKKTGNFLYDSWVFLDDDIDEATGELLKTGRSSFEKMLDTEDLDNNDNIPSLINSKPIDRIAERIFEEISGRDSVKNFPRFVSRDLRVILTITSLKPISYIVNFSRLKSAFLDSTPGHKINNHEVVAHFKVDYKARQDKRDFLNFSLKKEKDKNLLIKATKATGAFPFGLAPRHFDEEFSWTYISNSLKRRIQFKQKMDVKLSKKSKHFKFTGVDGGTINNEPFDEVLSTLQDKFGEPDPDTPKFGTIMIDPFPSFEGEMNTDDRKAYQKSVFDVLTKIVPTILNQARNKRNETFGSNFFKLLVFPIKWERYRVLKDHPPLATGGLGGFGGFFNIDFRIHDFFLGRNNARNFLRSYLMLEYNEDDPSYLFENLEKRAFNAFKRKYKDPETKETKFYMPIIPDLNLIEDRKTRSASPYRYDIDDFPKLDKAWLASLKKPMKRRIKLIIKKLKRTSVSKWYLKLLIFCFSWIIVNKLTNYFLDVIEEDFKSRKMT